MTTVTHPGPAALEQAATLARTAASRVAETLPSVHPVTVAEPQFGTALLESEPAAAFLAEAVGRPGRLVLVLGTERLQELTACQVTGAGLADVVQPALDAAAAALGMSLRAAVAVEPAGLTSLGGEVVVAPLVGAGGAAALVIDLATLELDAGSAPHEEAAFLLGATGQPVSSAPASAGQMTAAPTPAAAGAAQPAPVVRTPAHARGIELLAGVDMELTVELGRTRLPVRDLLALAPGDVLELDRAAGSPADLLVNGQLIARGEVVVVDEEFGLRITEILESTAS